MTEHDPVNHPSHYAGDDSGIECIDAIEAAFTFEEASGFRKINAFKYLWRAGKKGDELEDLEKAQWYLDREVWAQKERREGTVELVGGFSAGGKTLFLEEARKRAQAEYEAGIQRAAKALHSSIETAFSGGCCTGDDTSVGSPNEPSSDRPHHSPDHRPSASGPCPPPLLGASGH